MTVHSSGRHTVYPIFTAVIATVTFFWQMHLNTTENSSLNCFFSNWLRFFFVQWGHLKMKATVGSLIHNTQIGYEHKKDFTNKQWMHHLSHTRIKAVPTHFESWFWSSESLSWSRKRSVLTVRFLKVVSYVK